MVPDTAIVLGGGRLSPSELAPRTTHRVDRAVEVFESGRVDRLLMSGGTSYLEGASRGVAEAALMREHAVRRGVPADVILIEERSRETLGNAYFSRIEVLDPNGWTNVLVITSDFHMERARALFGKVLSPDCRCAFEAAPTGASPEVLAGWVAQEEQARAFYKRLLDDVVDGDVVAIGGLLDKAYRALDRNPDLTLGELEDLLRGPGL